MSVWQSQAPSAWQMREEIEELFAAGLTRDEVIDELVEQYGVWILMTPPAAGRFIWVYVTPFIAIGIGGVIAHVLIGRRRRGARPDEDVAVDDVDPDVEARVQRRLQEYL